MKLLDLTLPTPEENLALDEALLEAAEACAWPLEMLRIWESCETFVVLGRSSQAAREVNLARCRQRGIRVLRRTSGGAAVVVAPGSLMYAVVLSYERRPALHSLDLAHRFVLETTLRSLGPLLPGASHQGICDLVLNNRKISGNSVRCKRRSFLYHGTLLYGMDLGLVRAIAADAAAPARVPRESPARVVRHERGVGRRRLASSADRGLASRSHPTTTGRASACDNWSQSAIAATNGICSASAPKHAGPGAMFTRGTPRVSMLLKCAALMHGACSHNVSMASRDQSTRFSRHSSPYAPAAGTTRPGETEARPRLLPPRRPWKNRGVTMKLAPMLFLLVSTFTLMLSKNDSPIRVSVKFWPMLRDATKS